MLTQLQNYATPPIFSDPEKTRVARIAYLLAIAVMLVCIALIILFPLLIPPLYYRAWFLVPMVVLSPFLLWLLRRGKIQIASIGIVVGIWATLTATSVTGGAILAPSFHLYYLVVFAAGLLFGWRAAILAVLLVLLTGLGLYYAESNGWLPDLLTEGLLIRSWLIFDAAIVLVAVLAGLAIGEMDKALTTARSELAARIRADADRQRALTELANAYDSTIEGWARMMDLRDGETQDHSQRVAELTVKFAEKMGVSQEQLVHVRRGALLHDLGKMAISDAVLRKPGPLTDKEWIEMRRHPQYAYDVLSSIRYLHPAREIPYYHHEKWDGTGYPRGLRGQEIPLSARLFAVIDVWDALSSDRSYRSKFPPAYVLDYLRSQRGIQFDPNVVDAFLELIGESELLTPVGKAN